MDASLQSRAEQLASEFAGQATTAEDLNGLMRLMMKSALERMLNSEMDVHLGRRPRPRSRRRAAPGRAPAVGTRRRRLELGQANGRTVAMDVRRRRFKATWAS